ncbi:MAG: threonine--tRNA ligase [Candidatus ainarchaeum sp.]|nr:threonine--tRNA ligase [Candidatus ainarchaeum sp.]
MRILTVHADYIEVEPLKQAIKDAEALKAKGKERYEEVLVVFTAVEKGDDESAGEQLAKEAASVAEQVKTKKILLYPLVHLTSSPSPPAVARAVIAKGEAALRAKGYDAHHSPFGWYKGYTLKCKGHPLSELSREIRWPAATAAPPGAGKPGSASPKPVEVEAVSASLRQENELKSRFYIMDLDGNLHDVDKFDYKGHENLKKLATYETKKVRVYEKEPPHIKIMKEHSLIDYEPGSDSGNFRLLPKGRLMKKLLERMISDWCIGAGGFEVETPIMYDYEHPSLKKYLNRFPARQYVVISDEKKLFLRFAACFGQFLIAHDMVFSYRHLPLKMFELTRYSFRREQSGELAGLKRLRAFTMPDMHTFASDVKMAKEEFGKQYDLGLEWNRALGIETDVAFRIQDDFYKENKDWYVSMARRGGKPMLVELFKERYAYFITKFEFNFVDSMDKASALTTVQIDVENADTYDISYTDADGSRKRPLILHASISGSLERVIYALLEAEAMKMAQGKKAMFPVFLSPTQIRIIPVGDKHKARAMEAMRALDARQVRVDIDDRDEPLGKKIRDAQKEWIPFIAVIGDKEVESGLLAVNVRQPESKKDMAVGDLAALVEAQAQGKPFEKLSLPRELSRRPVI